MSVIIKSNVSASPSGQVLQFYSYEGFSGGDLQNKFTQNTTVSKLQEDIIGSGGSISAENSGPLVEATSGSYNGSASDYTQHIGPAIDIDFPYISFWCKFKSSNFRNVPVRLYTSSDSGLGLDYNSNGNEKIRAATSGGTLGLGKVSPFIRFFVEVWHDTSNILHARVNAGTEFETNNSLEAHPSPMPLRVGSRSKVIIDNIILADSRGGKHILPEYGDYLYNQGDGRSESEILNDILS
jgi:hypothetical protein